jgi:flavin reductase (DIM6/NTAB) family NADH-FMN oxidoreductase RutF
MGKKKIRPGTHLYPMPVTIVGANVKGKANFMTIAWCGIVENKPPMIMVACSKSHYTNEGIKENKTFSVNIPSEDLVEITDYIGIKSGKEIDKSKAFDIFYGDLKTAPMITEAPLNLECKLVKNVDLGGTHDVFIGEIVQTHADEDCLTNGLPDIKKLKPMVFSTNDNNYWKIGDHLGKAWSIGRNYDKK